jgi:tetratricopeptide (TPR) repeat protein
MMKFNLAAALGTLMQLEEAETLTREVLEGRIKMLGPEHDGTLAVVGNLASILGLQGQHDEAERLYRDLREKRHALSGPDHYSTRAALHGHGDELLALGRYAEAEERLTDALAREKRIEGPERPKTLEVERSVARLRLAEGHAKEALWILESNIAGTRNAEGNTLELGYALALLGETLNALERYEEAEEALAEALSLLGSELPETHPDLAEARSHRGTALAGLGRFDEAEPLLLEAHRALAAVERLDPERVSRAAERLADFHRGRGKAGRSPQVPGARSVKPSGAP